MPQADRAPPASPLRVRFAPEADYGPFVFRADDGSIQGLSVDLLGRLLARTGWQLDMLPARPLAENLAAARRGEVDLLSSLRATPERAAYLAFSAPYVSVPALLLHRAGAGPAQLGGYVGRAVAVGAGYAVQETVQRAHPGVRWRAVSDDAQALRLLAGGDVDGAVLDGASARFLIARLGLHGLAIGAPVGFDYALSFAWRRDRPDLGQALQEALAALPLAERDALVERWIGADTAGLSTAPRRWLGRLGLVAMLAGGAGWWLLHRRRRLRVASSEWPQDLHRGPQR